MDLSNCQCRSLMLRILVYSYFGEIINYLPVERHSFIVHLINSQCWEVGDQVKLRNDLR